MDPQAPRTRIARQNAESNRLLSSRGKRKPRSLQAIGVFVALTSEKATPPQRRQPRMIRRTLSSPFRGLRGCGQDRRSPASPVWPLPTTLLRVSRLRARPALLRRALSPAGAAKPLPRLQPPLSTQLHRAESSCCSTSSVPYAAKTSRAQSDGSTSCFLAVVWQSWLRESR
jgi:hypothetical protein